MASATKRDGGDASRDRSVIKFPHQMFRFISTPAAYIFMTFSTLLRV